MRVIYHLAVSLDGVAVHPAGPGWLQPFAEAAEAYIPRLLAEVDGLLMGRRTYEEALDLGWAFGDKPALVVSQRPGLRGPGVRVPSPEALFPQATAMGLTALWLVGGPTLAKALTAHLEEVRLAYCPVVLGQGRRFLDDFLELTLLDAETLPQGVLLARYRPKRFLTQEA